MGWTDVRTYVRTVNSWPIFFGIDGLPYFLTNGAPRARSSSIIRKFAIFANFTYNLDYSWIKLFYHDIETCILNNGWSSNLFKLERRVRQGCPLSPYLFILCAEVLADAIREDNNIKSILVDGYEIKISLYADDTTLILDGSRASFQNLLQILEFFSAISGLRLNYKKTEVLWIGANAGSEEKLCPENDLKSTRDKVKLSRCMALKRPRNNDKS